MSIKRILVLLISVSLLFAPPFSPLVRGELKGKNKYQASEISDLLIKLGEKTADISSIKTDFVQEKDLTIFQKKIVLRGKIYLQKPHKIAWHVDNPIKYKVLITDKFIRQWDEDTNEIHEISVSGNNIFKNVIDQLTIWFSGSYISLLENYEVHIKKQHPFVLEFIPKEKSIVKKVIKSITVMFREDERYLKQIEFQEISGDSTVIILENTVLNAPLDDSYFRITPQKKLGWDVTLPRHYYVFLPHLGDRNFFLTG
jgi:outer membrane lipoprotein-sorting protein